jgi:hypothetical protein
MSLPGWRELVFVIEEDPVNHVVFETLTRRVAVPAIGMAGLAGALMNPITMDAKKNRGKNNGKKKKKEDPNALCKQQVTQCTTFFTPACKGDLTCLAKVNRCCPPLGTCQFATAFSCLAAS